MLRSQEGRPGSHCQELVEVEEAVLHTETDEEEYHQVRDVAGPEKRTELAKLAFETTQANHRTTVHDIGEEPSFHARRDHACLYCLQSMEEMMAEGCHCYSCLRTNKAIHHDFTIYNQHVV
jgi:hypothetical protein